MRCCALTRWLSELFLYLATYVPTLHPMVWIRFTHRSVALICGSAARREKLVVSAVFAVLCVLCMRCLLSRFANTAELESYYQRVVEFHIAQNYCFDIDSSSTNNMFAMPLSIWI